MAYEDYMDQTLRQQAVIFLAPFHDKSVDWKQLQGYLVSRWDRVAESMPTHLTVEDLLEHVEKHMVQVTDDKAKITLSPEELEIANQTKTPVGTAVIPEPVKPDDHPEPIGTKDDDFYLNTRE